MADNFGINTTGGEKCVTVNCSTIAKIQLIKPPKAEALAYMAGTGPKPARIGQFWWLRANLRPRVAELHQIELPITADTTPTLIRTEPWERRPFVTWEDVPLQDQAEMLEPLRPLFDEMLTALVISDSLAAKTEEDFEPYVRFGGGALSVPGSTPGRREYLGRVDVRAGAGPHYFKEGPMQYVMSYDWDTETLSVYDIVICPGMGNPTYPSVDAALAAYNDGSLKLCSIDGEWYGDTKAHMDPEPPYFIDDAAAKRAEPMIYYPEGPRFTVSGRSVAWMGWDFHVDVNAINAMHISNLRFQNERIVYELHATDFTAVYSGYSTRKDIFYSDGGYEMGNCATTLRAGLQCPHQAVFMYGLGYDSGYVWGGDLTLDAEAPTICVFEAPDNEALFQHAQEKYEGLSKSALYVRGVFTVGNYDYTQTLKLYQDGAFDFFKQLSGYAVGAYILPGDSSNTALMSLFGALISTSALGALHTHSAGYKIDLDIGGLENSVKIKTPGYGNLIDLLNGAGLNTTGIVSASDDTYYFAETPLPNEGNWDMDGDSTWTPPPSCISAAADKKIVQYSTTSTTNLGHKRGYLITVPTSWPQMMPEGDPFLHLQNFTKCDYAVAVRKDSEFASAGQSVFGNLYPEPAAPGNDISQFIDGESLEGVDIVLYAHNTKFHWVKTEDVPVPSTMGKEISFAPFNYMTDDVSPIKHLQEDLYTYSTPDREAEPVPTCASTV